MIMVCVSASDVSRNTYNLLGFLLPWTWGICLGLLKQSAATAPYLGAWYLHTATLPDLERGVSPLHAPVPAQPLLLGCGVTPLGCRPGPWAWGSSSWPRFCCMVCPNSSVLPEEADGCKGPSLVPKLKFLMEFCQMKEVHTF